MIDCLLVLLIFFMSITSAEVLQIDADIKLPVADGAKKKEKTQAQEGALNLKWDPKTQKGIFNFMGKNYDDTTELVEILQKSKNNIPNYRIVVRGDERLPAVEIQRAMGVLASAGFDTITFSTLNQ